MKRARNIALRENGEKIPEALLLNPDNLFREKEGCV